MKVISEVPWSYVLFDDGQGWVLTFMIGGVVEIPVCVRLTAEEINMIKASKENLLDIMRNIELNRKGNKSREIIPPIFPDR